MIYIYRYIYVEYRYVDQHHHYCVRCTNTDKQI